MVLNLSQIDLNFQLPVVRFTEAKVRHSAVAGRAAAMLLKMTPDVPVSSGASAARSVMYPGSCSAVRFVVRERTAPSGLWDSRSGADGPVISLQTYGEA